MKAIVIDRMTKVKTETEGDSFQLFINDKYIGHIQASGDAIIVVSLLNRIELRGDV